VTLWGTRGSLPSPGPANVRYGGNTACVEVRAEGGGLVILDAGTGVYRLGFSLAPGTTRVDLLLTHLHMDHIIGMGFFAGFFRPEHDVHIWGPPCTQTLAERIGRYLSPPLFPVSLLDLPARVTFHDAPTGRFELPGIEVTTELVCHPGPTVGYRLSDGVGDLVYLPDHEPPLDNAALDPLTWLSGFDLAQSADVLIHDAQYTDAEYADRVGWGHRRCPTPWPSPPPAACGGSSRSITTRPTTTPPWIDSSTRRSAPVGTDSRSSRPARA
jgi:phosphoribosyl 1,2-cyclic phosphodiesterase